MRLREVTKCLKYNDGTRGRGPVPEAAAGVPGSADPPGRRCPEPRTTHLTVTTTLPRSHPHPVLQQPGRQGGENDSPREPSLARDFLRPQVLAPAPSAGVTGGAGHLALGSGGGAHGPESPFAGGPAGSAPCPRDPGPRCAPFPRG